MELDYNWGVVIDEVKVVFKKLRESVADGLNSLKSQIAGTVSHQGRHELD